MVGGGVAVLFKVDPALQPCLANAHVSVSAIVFPGAHGAAATVGTTYGADVEYFATADDYRGKYFSIAYSLFQVDRDGTLGTVVNPDRRSGDIVLFDKCSDRAGNEFAIPIPHAIQRYRVIVELFPVPAKDVPRLDKHPDILKDLPVLAQTESAIFRVDRLKKTKKKKSG